MPYCTTRAPTHPTSTKTDLVMYNSWAEMAPCVRGFEKAEFRHFDDRAAAEE